MATRWARVVRGFIAALVATFVAGFMHALAGGGAPGTLGIVIALAFTLPAAVFLAGTSMSWVRLSVTVMGSQIFFHATLGLGSGSGSLTLGQSSGHAHGATALPINDSSQTLDPDLIGQGFAMGPAHLIAAMITILALRYGEAAFWSVLALTGLSIAVALIRVPATTLWPHGLTRPSVVFAELASSLAELSPMRHRGPPSVVV
jgi:hypothetical protein